MEKYTDILIVGGGTGGCAAALGATSLGRSVILTEETDWIGGQLTAQCVPPDEHPWIEHFGCTRSYRKFRNGVRQYYRSHYPLITAARSDPYLNPGKGIVSRLCSEPRVALAVLNQMMAFPQSCGQLEVMLYRKPVSVDVLGDKIQSVTFKNQITGDLETITADYFLDATELGELLPLAEVEYVTGAESQSETGEPHSVNGPSEPNNVQAFTWCFPMAYDPAGNHVIDKPTQYDFWHNFIPKLTPAWPGKLLSWTYPHPIDMVPRSPFLFPENRDEIEPSVKPDAVLTRPGEVPKKSALHEINSMWAYRRIISSDHYAESNMKHEATLVNWPQNDYFLGSLLDISESEMQIHFENSKQLSLSLFYWLQTESPRPDGGVGYPGLYLRPDLVGTADGLAKYPYIRESRRIRAVYTVSELDVGAEARNGKRAAFFDDSIGVGAYRIDLHPSSNGRNYIDISTLPFQIPLGAILPVRVENLLPACKNIGTTHITNGCFRMHPIEWNIGEVAGMLGAFCIEQRLKPGQVRKESKLLNTFQSLLQRQGVELTWPEMRPI